MDGAGTIGRSARRRAVTRGKAGSPKEITPVPAQREYAVSRGSEGGICGPEHSKVRRKQFDLLEA